MTWRSSATSPRAALKGSAEVTPLKSQFQRTLKTKRSPELNSGNNPDFHTSKIGVICDASHIRPTFGPFQSPRSTLNGMRGVRNTARNTQHPHHQPLRSRSSPSSGVGPAQGDPQKRSSSSSHEELRLQTEFWHHALTYLTSNSCADAILLVSGFLTPIFN